METIQDLLAHLGYGKASAKKAAELLSESGSTLQLSTFARKIRHVAAEARKLGHRVIGDDSGYYVAMNDNEWKTYCTRRYAAIKDELVSLAAPEGISVPDLIKLVYKVKVDDNNFNLAL